jgi:hypothetical protein
VTSNIAFASTHQQDSRLFAAHHLSGARATQKASQANVRAAAADFMPKFFLASTSGWNSGNLKITARRKRTRMWRQAMEV